jgi:hypothetical protein
MATNDPFEVVPRIGGRGLIADGRAWSVYVMNGIADPSLIFESVKIVRRVRTFPINWHDLSDAELAVVMQQL